MHIQFYFLFSVEFCVIQYLLKALLKQLFVEILYESEFSVLNQ